MDDDNASLGKILDGILALVLMSECANHKDNAIGMFTAVACFFAVAISFFDAKWYTPIIRLVAFSAAAYSYTLYSDPVNLTILMYLSMPASPSNIQIAQLFLLIMRARGCTEEEAMILVGLQMTLEMNEQVSQTIDIDGVLPTMIMISSCFVDSDLTLSQRERLQKRISFAAVTALVLRIISSQILGLLEQHT